MEFPTKNKKELYTPSTGFTLIEAMVVISIIAILSTVSFASFSKLRDRTALEDTQATVIRSLEKSKNQSITGIGGIEHGVHIEGDKIVIFEGNIYTPGTGIEKNFPPSVTSDQTETTIVFSRLSAETGEDSAITLTHDNGNTALINVTYEGIISE